MIAVRPATGADVDFIVAAQSAPHARGFVLAATPEIVRASLARGDRATFVVDDGGERAGMLQFGLYDEAPWLIDFRRIVVTQPGRGIGSFAVRWSIAWAFEQRRAHRITLDVVESNGRARRLYERAGFVYEGTYRHGYRDADGAYANLCIYGLLATDPR